MPQLSVCPGAAQPLGPGPEHCMMNASGPGGWPALTGAAVAATDAIRKKIEQASRRAPMCSFRKRGSRGRYSVPVIGSFRPRRSRWFHGLALGPGEPAHDGFDASDEGVVIVVRFGCDRAAERNRDSARTRYAAKPRHHLIHAVDVCGNNWD